MYSTYNKGVLNPWISLYYNEKAMGFEHVFYSIPPSVVRLTCLPNVKC